MILIVSIPDICVLPHFLLSHEYRLARNTVYCAILSDQIVVGCPLGVPISYYIVCHDNSRHLLKYVWYLLVLYINSSVTCLKFTPKWSFSYFQPILVAISVTIATVKVESIQDLYTLAIVLIN